MTNYSRSVLKSNGLRHSKNPPVRFSFSLKIVPATIAKKLPLQLRPKPLFIAFFSLSHKRPTFAFTVESGYTLAFANRIAHSGSQGETGVLWMGALSLPSDRFARSGNPAWPGGRTAYFAAFGSWPGVLPKNAESLRDSDAHDARRCSEGVAAPLGRVIFLLLSKLRLVCPVPDTSFGSPDVPACAVPVQAASQLGSFRLGVQWFSVETGRIFCYNFGKRVT